MVSHRSRAGLMAAGAGRGWVYLVALALFAAPAAALAAELDYDVKIRGLADHDRLRETLELVSRVVTLRERTPASMDVLRRRIAGDLERFETVLRSEGYYDGLVEYRLDTTSSPLQLTVTVDPGPGYVVGDFAIVLVDDADLEAANVATEYSAGFGKTQRARAAKIVSAQERLLDRFSDAGYPFARSRERRVAVDHATRRVDVSVVVDPGPRARFGRVYIDGLDSVGEVFVWSRLRWREGDPYSPALVRETRRRLTDTRLFSSVSVRTGESIDEDGTVPMRIAVREAAHRTVGAGLRYSSSEGIGGNAFWEHRNLFHGGEKLRVDGRMSELESLLRLDFRKPDFVWADQTLIFDTSYGTTDNEAFETEKVVAGLGIERGVGGLLTGRAGIVFEYGPVESEATDGSVRLQDETFRLVGLPVEIRRDTTDSVLDPTEGSRMVLAAAPYIEQLGSDRGFLVSRVSDSVYLPLEPRRRLVAAVRVLIGSISAARNDRIPSDKRFYAGGGGSIRGYDYQLVGPLDDNNNPLGGRSVIEVGGELRWRLSRSFGLVPFIEGGNVFPDSLPDIVDASLLWGTGLGLRYFSPVGPVRLDVATPLSGREGVDDDFELYISLGQAF